MAKVYGLHVYCDLQFYPQTPKVSTHVTQINSLVYKTIHILHQKESMDVAQWQRCYLK